MIQNTGTWYDMSTVAPSDTTCQLKEFVKMCSIKDVVRLVTLVGFVSIGNIFVEWILHFKKVNIDIPQKINLVFLRT